MSYVPIIVKKRAPLPSDLMYQWEQGTVWVDETGGQVYDYIKVSGVREFRQRASGTTDIAALIHSATPKSPPVDADEIGIWDSISSALRKVTLANLKTYISGAYLLLTGGTMSGNIAMGGYKITGLAAPASNGDSVRATTKITEVLLESATDLKHSRQHAINSASDHTGYATQTNSGTGIIAIGTTAPATPSTNDLWIDTN